MNLLRARLAAGLKVCRKYRNAYIRKLQQREFEKLRNMVPALAGKQRSNKVSKIRVIEETIRYIDELHHALAARVQSTDNVTSLTSNIPLKISEEAVQSAAHSAFLEEAASAVLITRLAVNQAAVSSSSPVTTTLTFTFGNIATSTAPSVVTVTSPFCGENERQIPSYVIQSDVVSRHRPANQT